MIWYTHQETYQYLREIIVKYKQLLNILKSFHKASSFDVLFQTGLESIFVYFDRLSRAQRVGTEEEARFTVYKL